MARRKTEAETSASRTPIPIPLNQEANRIINRWCEQTGGSKTKFVQRLVEWFAASPDSVQQIVFGTVPGDMIEEYALRSAAYFDGLVRKNASADELGDLPADVATPDRAVAGATGRHGSSHSAGFLAQADGRAVHHIEGGKARRGKT